MQNIIYASQVSTVYFSVSSKGLPIFFLEYPNLNLPQSWHTRFFRPWVTTTAAEAMEEEEEEEEEAISDY